MKLAWRGGRRGLGRSAFRPAPFPKLLWPLGAADFPSRVFLPSASLGSSPDRRVLSPAPLQALFQGSRSTPAGRQPGSQVRKHIQR